MELQPSTMFWQALNFLVLAWLLTKFLFNPVMKAINDRQQVITASLEQAAQAQQALDKLQSERQSLLEEAHRQAEAILRQATDRAEKIKAEIIAEAEEHVRRRTEETEARLRREQEAIRQSLREETADLALSVVARILPKSVDLDLHRQLVNQAIHEVANDE